jgi:hypothetical protein
MARRDWEDKEARFHAAHAKTGISLEDWCNLEGIKFNTARRHIKLRKTAQKKMRIAQSDKGRKPNIHNAFNGSCAEKECAETPKTKRQHRGAGRPFEAHNTAALKHGGYGRRLLLSAATTEDALALSLHDELFHLRAASLTAAENIGRWKTQLPDANDEQRKTLYDLITAAENAMRRNAVTISGIECDIVMIAHRSADTNLKYTADERSQFELERDKELTPLEKRRRQLVNIKAEAEIDAIRRNAPPDDDENSPDGFEIEFIQGPKHDEDADPAE